MVAGADGLARWWPAARALVRAPALWPTAVRQARLLAAPGWWRRWPPVPRPDPAYLRFRILTAYGDAERPPDPGDVVAYLRWVRASR